MKLEEIINQALQGDSSAVMALYDAYKAPVYYLCRKLVQDDEAAAEMLKKSFLHAFRKLSLLRDPEDFPKWIMAVAANRCKSYVKDREPDRFEADTPENSTPCNYHVPEFATLSEVAADDNARQVISDAVNSLPVAPRFALMMCFFGAMNEVQASRIMECSEMATLNYLSQGTAVLQAAAATRDDVLPALKTFSDVQINAVLMRDAELVLVPGYVAKEILAGVSPLLSNRGAAPAHGDYRTPKRKGSVLVPLLILFLGIVVIFAGFMVGDYLRRNATPSDNTTVVYNPDDTDPIDSDTVNPNTTTAPHDTTDPGVTNPIVTAAPHDTTDPGVTTEPEGPVDPPANETPATSFTVKAVTGGVSVSKFTGHETQVVIPAKINGKNVVSIGDKAFYQSNVQSVVIPSTVKTIGVAAFGECKMLNSVSVPDSVTEIKAYAFRKCSSLAKLSLPDSVKTIGATALGDTAWMDDQKGKTDTYIIGNGLLIKFTGKGECKLPSSVTYISNAFYFNSYVTSVIIANGTTGIGQFAFCTCKNLTDITIPSSVTSIDKQAISDCASLSSIHVKKGSYADTWCKENGFASYITY